MEYFNLLEFNKEPFSNSPEPEFLFLSPQHNSCLQRLELAVRLRRGLNIVIGAVGTGKTTLCRRLIQQLAGSVADDTPPVETFLLLDPAVAGRAAFVRTVAMVLGVGALQDGEDEWQIKEKIKNFLFEKGVREEKNIVLIIDEGQKIPDDCLEILREFLNYETNSFKLLQIVIFAQPEFSKNLAARTNLLDRVNHIHYLRPLSFFQTKAMVEHRISVASMDPSRPPLFTLAGMMAVYLSTHGYPRRIVSLCHQTLLMMIIRGKNKAGWFLVRGSVNKMRTKTARLGWAALGILLVAFAAGAVFYLKDKTDARIPVVSHLQPAGIDMSLRESRAQKSGFRVPFTKNDLQAQEAFPEFLGTMEIKKGMTVMGILEWAYGENKPEIRRQFQAANPQITNLDQIREGDMIRLPAIPARVRPFKKEMILVVVESGQDLNRLYHAGVNAAGRDGDQPLIFLPYWNKRHGRCFALVLDKRFTTLQEAQSALRLLAEGRAATARVVSEWDADTVFFNSRITQQRDFNTRDR